MIEQLIENIIWQADYFLKESGEFYPFASVINAQGDLKPLGILLENDKPEPTEVMKELKQVLTSGKEKGVYKAYAIGINVRLNEPSPLGSDAIEIRVTGQDGFPLDIVYLPYTINAATRDIQYGDLIKN